eukprot:Gregarina_sp_Poly_1__4175@NODE_2286_length_2360_cov_11_684256_g1463_i0_p1_GENE_NODE_2286_length_2360_cov_11_684256_g1463_i0NODE_2286_length_2360_cov_11_684256_g1463_i0_p1_ORF_typecomplete_len465_score35_66Peptidase_C1/PF00112_23/5_3e68Inhibitor_I29/PF08246_12/1_5e16Peptidase_C1_2/PF03051_15/4_4e08TPP_enzyme_N/PF02776_18/0_12_NODE_2286_length_2360_cov_11_684256_g1463_i08932287
MALLFADRHDFTGPLIDDTFPPAEQGSKSSTPQSPRRHLDEHRPTFRRRLRDTGTLVLTLLAIMSCIIVLRRRQDNESNTNIGAQSGQDWGSQRRPYREKTIAGLYEYGRSYTLTHPDTLPHSYHLWTTEDYFEEFRAFCQKFQRDYQPHSLEYERRFKIFIGNLDLIHQHNIAGGSSYKLSLNQFADMTQREWAATYLTARSEDRPGGRPVLWSLAHVVNDTLPKEVNWIDRKCVTPVKDQAKCGSCWAFSATGAIEGAICAQTGILLNLSEQQLVDCAGPEGTHGCNGGFMDNAFKYVIDKGGLCTENDYPYVAKQQVCTDHCKRAAQIITMADIPRRNDKALRAAVAFHGPVAVGVEADKASFQFYHKGVLDLPCGKKLNHAVLLVGYSHDEERHEAYWYVKNSWGPTWGDQGFIRIGRKHHGKAGECGILLSPTIPIVAGDHDNGHPSIEALPQTDMFLH